MPLPSPRVLVVDDMEDIALGVASLLRAQGFHAWSRFDGPQALSFVRAHRPDVILLNWSMPGLDGLDVLDILKARPATARIRVLLTSAWPASKAVPAARAAGADGFLEMPFKVADAVAAIRHALGEAPAPFVATGAVPLTAMWGWTNP